MNQTQRETIANGVGRALVDVPEPPSARPIFMTQSPRAQTDVSDLAEKHRELLEAEKFIPVVLETAMADAARKIGCLDQYERRRAAIYAIIGSP